MLLLKRLTLAICLLSASLNASPTNLDDMSPDERQRVLQTIAVPQIVVDGLFKITKDTLDILTQAQIPVMACYGTLLDLGRHTVMLDNKAVAGLKQHDDDVDLALDINFGDQLLLQTPSFNNLEYKLVYDREYSRYIIEAKNMTEITLPNGNKINHKLSIDIFVFKELGDRYILADAKSKNKNVLKKGWFTKEEFENRTMHRFGPIHLAAPEDPSAYLKRKYGADWATKAYFTSNHMLPDAVTPYLWTLTDAEKIPALPSVALPDSEADKEQAYWDNFYKSNAVSPPSSFVEFCLPYMTPGSSILDLGCGNGRDTFAFARKGFELTGADFSHVAIKTNNEKAKLISVHSPSFQRLDVGSKAELDQLNGFKNIYARFFLHALRPDDLSTLMGFFHSQAPGTKLFLEFRTDKDPLLQLSDRISDNEGYADGHYRHFINFEAFKDDLHRLGFFLPLSIERDDLSIVVKDGYTDNPMLARIVAQKI